MSDFTNSLDRLNRQLKEQEAALAFVELGQSKKPSSTNHLSLVVRGQHDYTSDYLVNKLFNAMVMSNQDVIFGQLHSALTNEIALTKAAIVELVQANTHDTLNRTDSGHQRSELNLRRGLMRDLAHRCQEAFPRSLWINGSMLFAQTDREWLNSGWTRGDYETA